MASVVDICNLALSHLGDAATVSSISPPEGSPQAEYCQRFFPVARDALLEMFSWNFATKRVLLTEIADAAPVTWAYAYGMPNKCLRVLNIYPDGTIADDDGDDYTIESDGATTMIFTNTPLATARYIESVTDTTRYSPLFVNALSYLLASYLAGVVLKGGEGASMGKEMYKWFMQEYGKAAIANANSRKFTPEHDPSFLAARR
jgi:hypothetical protein